MTDMPRNARAALAYAARGWRVLPLEPSGKTPIGRMVPHGFQDSTIEEASILAWWMEMPEANIGVATGSVSGIWVIDIDGPVGAVNWWAWEAAHGAVHSLAQRTGRDDGGRQIILAWPAGRVIRSRAGVLPGIDVRGDGGYIVVAPSVHPSGRRYVWEGKVPISEASPDLLALVGSSPAPKKHHVSGGASTPYGQRAADDLETELSSCPRGGRDVLAFRCAVRLIELERHGDLAIGETESVLRRSLERCGYLSDPRKERGEGGFQRVLRSARAKADANQRRP
uniref:Putative bifunctional DNA primase/polymerase n=1 Tax=viral metagenome TaxID=1070528 RepID=A0A6M3J7I6_9ZZZZ